MDLNERISWLLLGFALGYVVARLQSARQAKTKGDNKVQERGRQSERGFMRYPLVADGLYFMVLIIVVWGAISAQRTSNRVQETQERIEHVTACNRVYLGTLLSAVEPRTTSSQKQADANTELQRSWYEFVRFQLHTPPYPEGDQRIKANEYADALRRFILAADRSKQQSNENPYPTMDQFSDCIQEVGASDE